jgi:hypothetical protein
MGAVLVLEDMTRINEQAQQIKLAALGAADCQYRARDPQSAGGNQPCCRDIAGRSCRGPRPSASLEIITKNTQRINHLVTDVMALNRRDRTHTERIPLQELLTEFLEEFCYSQTVDEGLFRLELADDAVICFDRGHLQQV